jgi:hypothetical protein
MILPQGSRLAVEDPSCLERRTFDGPTDLGADSALLIDKAQNLAQTRRQ